DRARGEDDPADHQSRDLDVGKIDGGPDRPLQDGGREALRGEGSGPKPRRGVGVRPNARVRIVIALAAAGGSGALSCGGNASPLGPRDAAADGSSSLGDADLPDAGPKFVSQGPYPASHPALPTVVEVDKTILAAPVIVPIVFMGDPQASYL